MAKSRKNERKWQKVAKMNEKGKKVAQIWSSRGQCDLCTYPAMYLHTPTQSTYYVQYHIKNFMNLSAYTPTYVCDTLEMKSFSIILPELYEQLG
jgi:hypothetical protein